MVAWFFIVEDDSKDDPFLFWFYLPPFDWTSYDDCS